MFILCLYFCFAFFFVFFFSFIMFFFFFFFFQAEDGIRDGTVTGVQTCALPISSGSAHALSLSPVQGPSGGTYRSRFTAWEDGGTEGSRSVTAGSSDTTFKIGRASCRERV